MNWWLTFHLLGVILWTGGLLMVSRMAAYHTAEPLEVQPRLAWIEGRLYWLVTVPGMVITVLTAIGVIATSPVAYGAEGWFHKKMALVLFLAFLHMVMHKKLKVLKADPADVSKTVFSAVHGTIGLTIIAILIMVKVQP